MPYTPTPPHHHHHFSSQCDLDCRLIDAHVLIKSAVTSCSPPTPDPRGLLEEWWCEVEGRRNEVGELVGADVGNVKNSDGCIIPHLWAYRQGEEEVGEREGGEMERDVYVRVRSHYRASPGMTGSNCAWVCAEERHGGNCTKSRTMKWDERDN